MKGAAKERWMELCQKAANEKDTAKLHELILEIDRLFNEKWKRLAEDSDEALSREN